jgi:hypothetical protein
MIPETISEEQNFHTIYILDSGWAVCGIPDNGDDYSLSDARINGDYSPKDIQRLSNSAEFSGATQMFLYVGEVEIVPERVLFSIPCEW